MRPPPDAYPKVRQVPDDAEHYRLKAQSAYVMIFKAGRRGPRATLE